MTRHGLELVLAGTALGAVFAAIVPLVVTLVARRGAGHSGSNECDPETTLC